MNLKSWQIEIMNKAGKKLMLRPRCPGKLSNPVKVNSTEKLQGTNPIIFYDEANGIDLDKLPKPIIKSGEVWCSLE